MKFVTVLTLCVLLGGYALAVDKLILKDGQVVTGQIQEETSTDVRIATADETMRIPLWAIEKIERDDEPGPDSGKGKGSAGSLERRKRDGRKMRPGDEPTEALLAWIDVCIEQLGSGDRAVRGSASSALKAAGSAAKPALEEAAAGDNELVAQRARVLLGRAAIPTVEEDGVGPLSLALSLTNDQKPQIAAIFEELRTKQRNVLSSAGSRDVDGKAIEEQLAALRAEADAKLAEVLSDVQMDRYRKMSEGH